MNKRLVLNYSSTTFSSVVPTMSGAKITVEAVLKWTSEAPNEKIPKLVLKAKGDLEEKGVKWGQEFVLDWPDSDLKQFENGLTFIREYVGQRAPRGEKRKEVFVDVYDWLRIGWVDENKIGKGYLRCTQNGQTMESEFADLEALVSVREALYLAKNS